jgi:hypothetical protein
VIETLEVAVTWRLVGAPINGGMGAREFAPPLFGSGDPGLVILATQVPREVKVLPRFSYIPPWTAIAGTVTVAISSDISDAAITSRTCLQKMRVMILASGKQQPQ